MNEYRRSDSCIEKIVPTDQKDHMLHFWDDLLSSIVENRYKLRKMSFQSMNSLKLQNFKTSTMNAEEHSQGSVSFASFLTLTLDDAFYSFAIRMLMQIG